LHTAKHKQTNKHLLGHDNVDKLLGLVNQKAASVGLPRKDMGKPVFFYTRQDLVQANGKRDRDAALTPSEGRLGRIVARQGVIVVVVYDEVALVELGRAAGLEVTRGFGKIRHAFVAVVEGEDERYRWGLLWQMGRRRVPIIFRQNKGQTSF
jgi:hypothetical protein